MEYLCSTKTPAWDRTSGYKEKRSDRFRTISEKSVKTTPKSTRENCQCGSLGLNSIYFKIICIIHTYMINEVIGFDNKIMNLILSHLLIIN